MKRQLGTPEDFRAAMQKKLRRVLPQSVWEHTDIQKFVRLCRKKDDPVVLEDACRVARYILFGMNLGRQEFASAETGQATTDYEVPAATLSTTVLSELEQERALVIATHAAIVATRSETVRRFRRDVCGDRRPTVEQVAEMMASDALYHFTLDQCRKWQVSIFGHRSTIVATEERPSAPGMLLIRRTIKVEPPGECHTVECETPDGIGREMYLQARNLALADPIGAAFSRLYCAWPGSVMSYLLTVVDEVKAACHCDTRSAINLVLRDQDPELKPIIIGQIDREYEGHPTLQLAMRLASWLSPETVQRAYREVQRQLLPGVNRPVGLRNLRLAQFVFNHRMGPNRQERTVQELMDLWNADCERSDNAQWRHKDKRNFDLAYKRTCKSLGLQPV